MKLRSKVTLIILIILGLMFSVTYLEGKRLLTNSYLQLEQQQSINHMQEVKGTIDRMLGEVSKMDAFWSIFDDAYQFMQDKNKEYIEGTVTTETLGQADVDVMLYFDKNGKYFYGLVVDDTREKEIPIPDKLFDYLTPNSKLVYQPNVDSSYQGFISIPSGIFLIASHAIVKSDSTGPVIGSQVLARRFNDKTIKKLSEILKLPLTMYRMNEVTNNTELKRVYSDSLKNNDIHVNVSKNEDELYGYLLLKDIDNKPIAIIKGIMTRAIYQSGITTITYFNYIFFGFGTIFVIVLSYLLRRIVITRLEKLNKAIINIEAKKELSLRVNEEGEDEITSVEKETNKMLSTIEEYSDQQKILLNKISTELDNVNKFSKKLQETETLLRDTINFMPSMLIILGKDLTITQLNSLSQQSLGKNIDDLKGKSVFEIYPFLVNYKEKILNALEKKSPETVERIEHQHGDAAHYYKLVIFPLSFPEKDQCLAIKIDDITDYVVLEDKIRQNDKLSSIGVLTAGIAHEIINPINYVESVIPLLKNNISYFIDTFNQLSTMKSDSDNTKQFDQLVTVAKYNEIDNKLNETNQLLDKVKASADKTDEIVKNLKSFVRMDENIKKKVNIHDGINSTVNILKYKCGDRISLIKEYSDIPEIECIPGKLNQVFMTIIFNAIDAIPNKGDIIIKTSQDKDNVIISIKDNGKGISDENKKKIFQPFFTTKKADSGTGLGLAISREIIQELRGSINFKSELGIGTEFIITLPKKAEYVTS